MNKIIAGLVLLILLLGFGIFKVMANNAGKDTLMQDKKVLVTYYSWGGNTKSIAQKIQSITGGDIFEIEAKTPYPTDYTETTVVAKEQIQNGVSVELKQTIDVSDYDIIFVGTPAWWYTMAPAVKTFLTNGNFENKTVVPFITHGGGGEYSIAKEMGQYAKGSKIAKSYSVYGKGDMSTQKELENWIKEIK